MSHSLRVVNLYNSVSEHNLQQRNRIVSDIEYNVGVLLRNFSNPRFHTLDVWIGLTGGWHLEAVIKNLPMKKTTAIKCENVKSLKEYLKCIMKEGIHSIKAREDDQVFYFYNLEDQLSMQKIK